MGPFYSCIFTNGESYLVGPRDESIKILPILVGFEGGGQKPRVKVFGRFRNWKYPGNRPSERHIALPTS